MKIVIDIPDDDYRYIKLLHEGFTDYQTTLKLYRAVKSGTVERPQKWETIGGGEWVLKDHYWYLIAHKDYGTPMKAKYHSDCPHFTFFDASGERATYLFENKITHYMELPDIPIGGTKNEL